MLIVKLYPICEHRDIWSFREQPGTSPVRVRVPKGSKLREVRGMGQCMSLVLFVPNPTNKLFLGGWPANAIMREVGAGGRFRLVKTKGRECVTG